MEIEQESALSAYLNYVGERTAEARREKTRHEGLAVLRSSGWELRSLVDDAEGSRQFDELIKATARAFARDPTRPGTNWRRPLQNFFRRSGLYQDVFAGKVPAGDSAYRLYKSAFTRTEISKISTTYFTPLEFISFAEEDMDFGHFRVQRLTSDELDQKLQQPTCRIFYPWAIIDTKLLSQYWFLSCSEPSQARELGGMKVTLDFRVRPKYSGFPKPVEDALKRLVLFPWGTSSRPLQGALDLGTLKVWDAPVTFRVPFVSAVSDSLTDTIFAAPSAASLSTHPEIDLETGEPLGEVPFFYVHLQKEPIAPGQRTNQEFVDFVRWADTALKSGCANYPFIDLAAGFLVKAFFSEGLESLLWNITAIEAALGENREGGLTKLLKSRVGLIFGGNDEQRHGYAKLFGELYNFRCKLVHGNEGLEKNSERSDKKQAYQHHLGQAREIARGVVVWMLHYLDHLRSTLPAGTAMPKRADLLAALDAGPASALLSHLPPGFPSVQGWHDL